MVLRNIRGRPCALTFGLYGSAEMEHDKFNVVNQ